MGGCATKPNVLKEEGEAPKPVEDVAAAAAVDDTSKDVSAGEENLEEVADGRKSLGNFFSEKEAEENTVTVSGEKPAEEKEDAKPEQQEEKKATEASEVQADAAAAAADEEKQ
ncbi:uncharacterized protein LOC110108700 [Dendrobium catenatum]|uniref:Uncharacterized protein n=1 Tax=Dendrobium catenatum TaxID=906689 RepID=A0A2I0W4U8_9ASPA|nr:uncharacterized protein LOC110108700 [Dendrobium catenatum]PKU70683.1 hypothetical protein MA16_Dca016881 [Dendrobium catenatum]